MRRVNPVLDGLLRHGKKRFSEAPLFRANLITLLHYLHSLGFGDGVQAAQAAGAGCSSRTSSTADSVRSIFQSDVYMPS